MLETFFLRHPRSVGETYGEHFAKAAEFGAHLFAAALACVAHALVPALFQATASRIVANLHAGMIENRRRRLERGLAPDYQI